MGSPSGPSNLMIVRTSDLTPDPLLIPINYVGSALWNPAY